jgi:transposase-like protein
MDMSLVLCPYCNSDQLIRKGTRKNRYRTVPLYQCKNCDRYFSLAALAGVKYPPRAILTALGLYNLGYSQSRVAEKISAKYHVKIPQRTVSSWVERYAKLCPFGRLRAKAAKLYRPAEMVSRISLQHRQVYTYKLHQAKLRLLENTLQSPQDYERLREYLLSIAEAKFPHRLFDSRHGIEAGFEQRALRSSQMGLQFLPIVSNRKENLANELAAFGLLLAKTKKERHEQIQDFMLLNDSSTIASEVPVYLAAENVSYFHGKGFYLPVSEKETPIMGHIDILQVRQRYIHILDFKPEARKVRPVSQLTIYALALASHTKLPLRLFKCAWFDEKDYFEFFPLRAVYPQKIAFRNASKWLQGRIGA